MIIMNERVAINEIMEEAQKRHAAHFLMIMKVAIHTGGKCIQFPKFFPNYQKKGRCHFVSQCVKEIAESS